MIILEFIIVENWSYEYYRNCSDSLFYNLKIYEFNNFRFCSHHISLRKIMCLTKISFAYAIHIIRSKYYLCTYFYIQYQNSSATFFLLFDCFSCSVGVGLVGGWLWHQLCAAPNCVATLLFVRVGGGEVIIASLNLIVTSKLELFVIFLPSSGSV